MPGGRPVGPTGSLWDAIDTYDGLAVRRLHPRRSLPPAKNRQPPGARLTEKSQRHRELLNGSLMLPVGWYVPALSFSLPLRVSHLLTICLLCLSALVRLFLLFFFSSVHSFLFLLLSPTPHLSFALTICTRVCMCVCSRSFEATELLFPAWVVPSGSSRIKLDNKPSESKRRESRPAKSESMKG